MTKPMGIRYWLVVVALMALAGCQTTPSSQQAASSPQGSAAPAESTEPAARTETGPAHEVAPNRAAADLRIFLADTNPHPGWAQVNLKPNGILYVRTDAIIDRRDLVGIQSATDKSGGGVLVVVLGDEGYKKMHDVTAANPGMRLALVVGHQMLSAPGYASPISKKQLAFGVGSARNAELAARAVAGVGPSDAAPAAQQ